MSSSFPSKKCGESGAFAHPKRLPLITPPSMLLGLMYSTGVLGCTGSVGQRFILLLAQHPHLVLHAVGASSRSAGKKYKDAVKWKQALPMGKHVEDLVVRECKSSEFADCDIVFSGLDSDVAGEIGNIIICPCCVR